VTAADPVSPIGAHQLLVFLLQVAVLLLLAVTLGRLAVRLRLPAIVGELLAGALLGPSILGNLAPAFTAWLLPARPDQAHLLDAVGLLGVLLMVGITGAQLDIAMLRRQRATAVRVSLAGLLIPLGLGVAAGYALPMSFAAPGTDRLTFALFIGVAMCVTAIPVIAKTLTDMRLLHRDVGQLTLAAGMVDDAVGWFLLSVVAAMATVGIRAGALALSVVSLVGFVAAALALGRPLVRAALRLAARSREPGPTIAVTVVIILLSGAATHALGMEPIFGAFIAGVVIGWPDPPRARHAGAVLSDRVLGGPVLGGPALVDPPLGGPALVDPALIDPVPVNPPPCDPRRLAPLHSIVMSVLAPIFLATAGLRMDLTALARPAVLLAALGVLAIAVVGKFVGAYAGARASHLSHWEGLALGAGMNSRGVVEVVVAMVGLRLGVLSTAAYTIVVLVAIVTSLSAPHLLRWAMARVDATDEERRRAKELAAWTA
jgi:Kef-type K+ transport system membrane component KefB